MPLARAGKRRCAATPKRYCERRLSPRMVQYLHAVLRNALQHAVREEWNAVHHRIQFTFGWANWITP